MSDEFTVTNIAKKTKEGEEIRVEQEERRCGYCGVILFSHETTLSKTGKPMCGTCVNAWPAKSYTAQVFKPKRTYVCSYCGAIEEKVWIYSGNGLIRCKDCVVSGWKDDPDNERA